jgi:hypothetical protein
VSREDFSKLFGITDILGLAYDEKKVYTWLILVCSGDSWFTRCLHIAKIHCSNAVNLSKNTVGIKKPEIYDALKHYISSKIRPKSIITA